jgi:hypothetical protein
MGHILVMYNNEGVYDILLNGSNSNVSVIVAIKLEEDP